MPVVLRERGYIIRFFSLDVGEPPHVHVTRGEAAAKYWMTPVRLVWQHGFSRPELTEVRKILQANEQMILEQWNDFFDL